MAPPTLTAGLSLGPEWRVEAFTPGARLVLKKDTTGDRTRARSSAVVAVGSLAAAAALASATPPGMGLVTWPVAFFLFVVALLAVPAALRSFRRARLGVTLEASPDGVVGWPVPTGLLHDLRAMPRRCAAAEVREVKVHTADHPPLTLSILEIHLANGTRLAGPEVATPEGASPPLDAVAEALRTLLKPR
ncbi:MAG: hypothetical protein AB1938_29700 [Myxococcota bacterium]